MKLITAEKKITETLGKRKIITRQSKTSSNLHECDFNVRVGQAVYIHLPQVLRFQNDDSEFPRGGNIAQRKADFTQSVLESVSKETLINS